MRYAVDLTSNQYGDTSRRVFGTIDAAVNYKYALLDRISDTFLQEHLDYEETNLGACNEFVREDSIRAFEEEVLRYIDITRVE